MEATFKAYRGRILTQDQMMEICEGNISQLSQMMVDVIPAIIKDEQGHPKCQRCQNQDVFLFGEIPSLDDGSSRYYCRQCIQMGRVLEGEYLYMINSKQEAILDSAKSRLTWHGKLSPQQAQASRELIKSLEDKTKPHLVYAVTGAGKTEMMFSLIDTVLKQGGRVAMVSPRIDVCLELYPRIQAAFQHTECLLMYGDTDQVYKYTPIVIATTHQLLKFRYAFDLTIVDEVDAFPYVNSILLHLAVQTSVRKDTGKLIYLTATPDAHLFQQMREGSLGVTRLPARFHGYPLVVPQFLWIGEWEPAVLNNKPQRKLKSILQSFIQESGCKIIFVPSICLAEGMFQWLQRYFPSTNIAVVHSQDPERKEKVNSMRQGDLDVLISTTILERGVTFVNCQVLVLGANSDMFSSSALVQMAGRVGRKAEFPWGVLIFAHEGISRSMVEAKRQIIEMNHLAQQRGLLHE